MLLELFRLDTSTVQDIKTTALQAHEERRADLETYRECPRCKGHHSVRGNFDDLCDGCCRTLIDSFPFHPAVPEIQRCLMRWRKQ